VSLNLLWCAPGKLGGGGCHDLSTTETTEFLILARDGATLKFGKEDGAHNGTSDAQRYQSYMAALHIKGTCPF